MTCRQPDEPGAKLAAFKPTAEGPVFSGAGSRWLSSSPDLLQLRPRGRQCHAIPANRGVHERRNSESASSSCARLVQVAAADLFAAAVQQDITLRTESVKDGPLPSPGLAVDPSERESERAAVIQTS
jgi:hypothetical protein